MQKNKILLESGCEITKLLEILKLHFNKKIKNILGRISIISIKEILSVIHLRKQIHFSIIFSKHVRGWRNKW